MVIDGVTGVMATEKVDGVTDYSFTFEGLDASKFYEGCVITGQFTTYVGVMPMSSTGYLKLTGIE